MKRTSTAVWQGSGKEGLGHLTTQSNILKNTQYNWHSRFEEGTGTNPEELLAAAHAGCFTMKLSFLLGDAGITSVHIETSSTVSIESGNITGSHLVVKAQAPGLTHEKLEECALNAKVNCPISKALACPITMEVVKSEKEVA
jgi:osmotically inducible protein OsmC